MSTPFNLLGLAVALALAGCSQTAPSADSADMATPPHAMAEAPAATDTATAADADAAAVPAPQLQAAMRDLWHGHVVHARDYALAVHAGNDADATAAADAVVDNAKQISGAVAGFYGEAGGDQMLTLLGGHWGAVKAMTDASAANDEAGAAKAIDDLHANAAAIAKFLAGANPNLSEDTVHGLLLAHGAHHVQQVKLILADDTAGEAAEWAAMQSHMDMIADALAAAIARQFPDKAS
ncbi:hypothetical protein [Luteimonas lutimaris]|uniref:DUF305 domain-containing protein n=1 Tax=Luteimonas lutimaris TaxID=698645 RepID=A0ABP7MZ87_9GAMM